MTTEATATQLETSEEVTGEPTMTDTPTEAVQGLEGLFPNTPPPDRPVQQPQAHRARVTGVTGQTGTSKTSGEPWGALNIAFKSLDNGADDSLFLGLPMEYINDVQVDPATLSDEPGVASNGKEIPSVRAQYAVRVRNSKGNGTIETLVNWAIKQGNRITTPRVPRTFEQLAEYLNELTVGTEVVALYRPQGGEGEFADRLKCQGFGDINNYESPKFFKNYRKVGLGE